MSLSRHTRVPQLSAADLRVLAGCTLRVLRDSNRTLDIIRAEELSAQTQLKSLLQAGLFELDDEARALFADRPILAQTDLDARRTSDSPTNAAGAPWRSQR